jgi:hypothetical protein
VGDGVCEIIRLTDNELVCTPPVEKPNRRNSAMCSNDGLALDVRSFNTTIINLGIRERTSRPYLLLFPVIWRQFLADD